MFQQKLEISYVIQYADEVDLNSNRKLFEDNAQCVRTALVAYNAVFDDLGNLSKKEYLIKIVKDAITMIGLRQKVPWDFSDHFREVTKMVTPGSVAKRKYM